MDPHAELEQLLAGLLDGPRTEARNERFAALLRAHPELQDEYLDYLQLHALLQWRAGKAAPHQEPAVALNIAPSARNAVGGQPRRWLRRTALAAAVLLGAVGLGVLLLSRSPEASAASDVVERLIDLNLDLAQTPSRDERTRIYSQQVTNLKATLAKTKLAAEDRDLAEALLENSSWLTNNDDPLAEADRFNDLADKLVARLDAATAARDELRIVKLADTYHRLTEVGVDANLDRALAAGALSGERQQKVERTLRCDANRAKKLAEILERNPEAPRKAIRRAMKSRLHRSMRRHKMAN